MPGLSRADHSISPPRIDVPRIYNAADDLLERNLEAGRGGKLAYIDDSGRYTYAELAERVDRAASALVGLGLRPEQRIVVALHDTIDFPTAFLGAIKAGIVPVAVNTLLTAKDYALHPGRQSCAALVVSAPLLSVFEEPLQDGGRMFVKEIIVSGNADTRYRHLEKLLAAAPETVEAAPTTADDVVLLAVFVRIDRRAQGRGAPALGA